MIVVRQNFRNSARPHLVHRDTVGQAVTFVESGFVKPQAVEKCFGRMPDNFNFLRFD
jgi:hypothetical protein